jgi:putative (di)nucleoside polyphosphate hydrolase
MKRDPVYRPGVGLMLINRAGQVFVGRRIDMAEVAWQMPQGGIDPGEPPRAAALRELTEEVGTDKAEIVAESKSWLRYDLPPDLAARMWGGRHRGQRQKWFALRFTGEDRDIVLDGAHPEFRDWRWVAPEELERLIVPFKRRVYRKVVAEFAPVVRRIARAGEPRSRRPGA